MHDQQENCQCLHSKSLHGLGGCTECGCLCFKSIVCHHRHLRRSCYECDLEEQIRELEAERNIYKQIAIKIHSTLVDKKLCLDDSLSCVQKEFDRFFSFKK